MKYGDKFLAHELLPIGATDEEIESYRARGYEILKIPPGYRRIILSMNNI